MMQTGLEVVFVLLLAHVLSDFPLQTSRMVAGKAQGAPLAYASHLSTHLMVTLVGLAIFVDVPILRRETAFALGLLVLGHGALDGLKSGLIHLRPGADGWLLFLLDQFAHVLIVLSAASLLPEVSLSVDGVCETWSAHRLTVLSEALVLAVFIFPTGYLIRYLLRPLSGHLDDRSADQGLANAGLILGWIERALLLFAFAGGFVTGVGLIVAAKAVARFPAFKDRAFAEYFLIGSLLSVSFAALGAVVLQYVRANLAAWFPT